MGTGSLLGCQTFCASSAAAAAASSRIILFLLLVSDSRYTRQVDFNSILHLKGPGRLVHSVLVNAHLSWRWFSRNNVAEITQPTFVI